MHLGKKGMGSHKHGVSGKASPSPGYKMARTREANALANEERAKRLKHKTYTSLHELMAARKSGQY